MTNLPSNRLQLSGQISSEVQVRFSPSGIGHAEFWFSHQSTQYEGNLSRQVYCKIRAVVSGEVFNTHKAVLQIDAQLMLIGFLNVREQRSGAQEMVFYVQHLELSKEHQHDQETSAISPMA